MDKQNLRKKILELRDSIPEEERTRVHGEIQNHLETLPLFRQAENVFCFVSMGTEVNTRRILENLMARGVHVSVPLCQKGGIMTAREITALSELSPGMMGILEPPKDNPVTPPEELDLVILPCVAAGRRGERLGYGGGYYDRYLEEIQRRGGSAQTVLLCPEILLTENIPEDPWDKRSDYLITEKAVYELC